MLRQVGGRTQRREAFPQVLQRVVMAPGLGIALEQVVAGGNPVTQRTKTSPHAAPRGME